MPKQTHIETRWTCAQCGMIGSILDVVTAATLELLRKQNVLESTVKGTLADHEAKLVRMGWDEKWPLCPGCNT